MIIVFFYKDYNNILDNINIFKIYDLIQEYELL